MNREILFRGKPMFRESNEFVYGYYKHGNIADVETDFILHLPEYKNEINEVAVCTSTVGQYTGLTDKNGVKIFEGDIVKNVDGVYVVEYCKNLTRFALVHDGLMSGRPVSSGTVISNIHDNPELLKGEENV